MRGGELFLRIWVLPRRSVTPERTDVTGTLHRGMLGRRGYDETSARDVARRIQIRVTSDLDYDDLDDCDRLQNTAMVGVSFDGVPAAGSG